jgi:outer membrane PBP1 activator LpoA protein
MIAPDCNFDALVQIGSQLPLNRAVRSYTAGYVQAAKSPAEAETAEMTAFADIPLVALRNLGVLQQIARQTISVGYSLRKLFAK